MGKLSVGSRLWYDHVTFLLRANQNLAETLSMIDWPAHTITVQHPRSPRYCPVSSAGGAIFILALQESLDHVI